MDIKEKLQTLSRYAVELLLLAAWAVLMFFPGWADTRGFQIFLAVSIACAVIHSLCRKRFFPGQNISRAEKTTAACLIAALFLRLVFF